LVAGGGIGTADLGVMNPWPPLSRFPINPERIAPIESLMCFMRHINPAMSGKGLASPAPQGLNALCAGTSLAFEGKVGQMTQVQTPPEFLSRDQLTWIQKRRAGFFLLRDDAGN
jgi:hypothetical protein